MKQENLFKGGKDRHMLPHRPGPFQGNLAGTGTEEDEVPKNECHQHKHENKTAVKKKVSLKMLKKNPRDNEGGERKKQG